MSYNYAEENAFLKSFAPEKQEPPTPVTDEDIQKIREEYPGIPEDYLSYLKYIGWGDLRNCRYMVYAGPSTLSDIGIDDEDYPLDEKVVFFGDDFAGDLTGFNIDDNFAIVRLDHVDGDLVNQNKSFRDYIRERMGMSPEGEDLYKGYS